MRLLSVRGVRHGLREGERLMGKKSVSDIALDLSTDQGFALDALDKNDRL